MISLFAELWEVLRPFQDFLTAILLSLVTAFLLSLFRPRVKLIWGSTSLNFHRFKMSNEGGPIQVTTEKLFVQNMGKKAATNVELVLSDMPTSYTLWTPREHKKGLLDGGGFFIKFESLAPSELLIVDTIDVDLRNPRLVAVNCPEAISKRVEFLPQRQFGKLILGTIGYLMIAGLVGTMYLALQIVLGSSGQ